MRPPAASRLVAPVLAACTLAACASSKREPEPGAGAPTPVPVRVQTMGEARGTTLAVASSIPEAIGATVEAPPGGAWVGLIQAWEILKLNPDQINSDAYLLSVQNARVRRQLGGKPMSRYLDCGMGQQGATADAYDIALSVRSQLRAAEGGKTEVLSLVTATARAGVTSNSSVQCSSTGELEKRIVDLTRERAGAK
jgi:hypothetical protein